MILSEMISKNIKIRPPFRPPLIFWKIKKPVNQGLTGLCFNVRAVWTGLEPATPCVTGRYSNQLNYQTNFFHLREQRQLLENCVMLSLKRVQK